MPLIVHLSPCIQVESQSLKASNQYNAPSPPPPTQLLQGPGAPPPRMMATKDGQKIAKGPGIWPYFRNSVVPWSLVRMSLSVLVICQKGVSLIPVNKSWLE